MAAAITLAQSSGLAGSTIYMSGTGFGPAETVAVAAGGRFAGVFTTDHVGAFAGQVTLPQNIPANALPSAACKVSATGNTSGDTASADFTVS